MQANLLQQGAELMLYGMSTVFVFLAILVIVSSLMSYVLQRIVKAEPVIAASSAHVTPTTGPNDQQLMAVMSAAIHKYRSRNK